MRAGLEKVVERNTQIKEKTHLKDENGLSF